MKDLLNGEIDRLYFRTSRVRRWEREIFTTNPTGVNKGLWADYGDGDHCISSCNIKYLQFQHLKIPKPMKG